MSIIEDLDIMTNMNKTKAEVLYDIILNTVNLDIVDINRSYMNSIISNSVALYNTMKQTGIIKEIER